MKVLRKVKTTGGQTKKTLDSHWKEAVNNLVKKTGRYSRCLIQ